MSLIAWNEKLNVNIYEIDRQHQLLVKMTNDLYQAMHASKDKEILASLLEKMIIYAAMHFAKEEYYFDVFKYPDSKRHKQEHLDFEKKVNDFEDDFINDRQDLSEEVVSFLADWLVDHIQGSDKKYSKFLTDRGVK